MILVISGINVLGLAALIWAVNRQPLIFSKEVGVNIIVLLFSCSAFHALTGLMILFDMIEATNQTLVNVLSSNQSSLLQLGTYSFWALIYAGFGSGFIFLRLKNISAPH